MPPLIASSASRWSKWMSAISGTTVFCDDLRDGGGGALVRHGDADDLRACVGQAGDLLDRGPGVGGVGVRHRLDDDVGVAADLDVADVDGPRDAAGCQWQTVRRS